MHGTMLVIPVRGCVHPKTPPMGKHVSKVPHSYLEPIPIIIYLGWCRAVVTDGVTLGHPCCNVHNCPEPLPTNRVKHCRTHSHLEAQCAVIECTAPRAPRSLVCTLPEHHALEVARRILGSSQFQLKERLRRQGAVVASSSIPAGSAPVLSGGDSDDDEILPRVDEGAKPDAGNRAPRVRWGRRRTHNEQLIVCCCGVIIGRTTMFGAESLTLVKVSHWPQLVSY